MGWFLKILPQARREWIAAADLNTIMSIGHSFFPWSESPFRRILASLPHPDRLWRASPAWVSPYPLDLGGASLTYIMD